LQAAGVDMDEDCPAGMHDTAQADGGCAVSLRQLRASGAEQKVLATAGRAAAAAADAANPAGTVAPPTAASLTADAPSPSDDGAASADSPSPSDEVPDPYKVPGGWGEGADFANSFDTPQQNDSDSMSAMWGWGSCAQYGCISYYLPHLPCQCNYACEKYKTCCGDYWKRCYWRYHHHQQYHAPAPVPHSSKKILTLFHQTSQQAADMIVQNGFRPGTQGWCGGGIYFALSPQATTTKAIGPDSHKGAMLQAEVDVGRVKYMSKTCDRGLTGETVVREGYDSVSFNPGDGQEYIVYSSSKVISVKQIPM